MYIISILFSYPGCNFDKRTYYAVSCDKHLTNVISDAAAIDLCNGKNLRISTFYSPRIPTKTFLKIKCTGGRTISYWSDLPRK